jgi:O-acetyl-ADP-ribose deacetylase (regulator of RNase III)
MITYVKGNIFESPAKVLVNTVNTVGVMGKGIAKRFKEIYPEMFTQYQVLCDKKQLDIGKLWLFKTPNKWILNFPTKVHWRNPSKSEYIQAGLIKFVATYATHAITSIAFPRLGCGNGELDWKTIVQPLMTKYLFNLPIDIFIYEHTEEAGIPEHRDIESMTIWLRSEPRALPFTEMWADLCNQIKQEKSLRSWESETEFIVSIVNKPELGLQITVGSLSVWNRLKELIGKLIQGNKHPKILDRQSIFIPQIALLDLWQNVKEYGFCVPRIMPAGLDVLSSYILPLMSLLDYMNAVTMSFLSVKGNRIQQKGLQLYAPPASQITTQHEAVYASDPK